MVNSLNWAESIGFTGSYLVNAWDAFRGGDEASMGQWFDDVLLDVATLSARASGELDGLVLSEVELWNDAARILEDAAALLRSISKDWGK